MNGLSRYGKKIVSLMFAVFIISIGIFSTSFNSYASGPYHVPFQEPSVGHGQGYIILELQNKVSGSKVLNMFAWSVGCFDDSGSATADFDSLYTAINLTDSVFTINFEVENLTTPFDCVVAYYNGSGKTRVVMTDALTTHTSYSMNYANDGDGYNIVGYQFKGSVTNFSESNSNYNFNVPMVTWGGETAIINVMLDITREILSLNTMLSGRLDGLNATVSDKLDDLISKVSSIWYDIDYVEEYLTEIRNYIEYYLPAMDYELDCIDEELDRIYAKIDALLEEQKKSNTWLGKIWDSLQEIIKSNSSDKSKSDKFNSDSNSQKSEIDDLNNQNQVNKVDVNNASSQVDSNINYDNMAQYGGVLAAITNNSFVLQMVLAVVSIAIIAYVLFGKR